MAKGAMAKFVPSANPDYEGGDSIIWGLIRGAPDLMKKTRAAGHNFWQMDNAYFHRNKYYRITKNALQMAPVDKGPERWEKIRGKIKFQQWREGKHILFALSTPFMYQVHGVKIEKHVDEVIAELKKYTARKIVVRPKAANHPIEDDLKNCHALVTYSSMACLDALMAGVPSFTVGPCVMSHLTQPLSEIETPNRFEREPLFHSMAWGQFTIEEMQSGFAWSNVC